MKYLLLISIMVLGSIQVMLSQGKAKGIAEPGFDQWVGIYQGDIDSSEQFIIKIENGRLMLEIKGQGQTDLKPLSGNRFKLNHVKIETIIQFVQDSMVQGQKMIWIQKIPKSEWTRIRDLSKDSSSIIGNYRFKKNPYAIYRISEENGHVLATTGMAKFELSPLSDNKYEYRKADVKFVFEFVKDDQGIFQKLILARSGSIDFIKLRENRGGVTAYNYGFHRESGFTRADTVRGMLTPLRTCYDVLFYDLDVTIEPETKSIHGNCIIRFKTIQAFDKIQIDLFANMSIDKILFHEQELHYVREFNAVYIQFPNHIERDRIDQINIFYSGKPQVPDPSVLAGGFLWLQNKDGKLWIESVCQGSGASLWWPCKDHLSDKPDSMKISVTVPNGLTDISNGRLKNKIVLSDNRTRFEWYVNYPISTYDIAVNIGDYTHFSDSYIAHSDTLKLDYYCMPYNIGKAKEIFSQVKPMLTLYEKDFGPYPFLRDGFTLIESLYPMEHQSAVSIGPINNPVTSNQFDLKELTRTMWHESAHEWWGNNVTCKDMADLWIHEAFATYSEVLDYDAFYGREEALKYLRNGAPVNKEPIIGHYYVNDFHLGDMYSKGALMLHTLQNVINNDSVWFKILQGIQEHFRYQTVTTEDIIDFFNQSTRKNYTSFFNQYLRYATIPQLSLKIKAVGTTLQVQYKWDAEESGFDMPIRVKTSKNNFGFIFPSKDWQTIRLDNMEFKDFQVDTDDFYVQVRLE
jgi:hypothetical protein